MPTPLPADCAYQLCGCARLYPRTHASRRHVTLAYYLRDCPPPDGARVINVAPQFALQNLNVSPPSA